MPTFRSIEHSILRDGKVIIVSLLEWALWASSDKDFEKRRVAKTKIGDVLISTVFLGLDHGFEQGHPLWFETLVFGGKLDMEMERYETLEEAMAGHERMVAKVRECEVQP